MLIILAGCVGFTSCKKETPCVGCDAKKNKSPIAIAGPDQLITLPTDSVLLDGSSSSDPDGMISGWLWTKISGPPLFNIIKPSDSTTKVRALVTGAYQFELKITDNGGLSAKDTMRVTVNDPANRPPVANAGVDQTIIYNTITLNGSGSTDPDNNISNYAWTKISGPSSFSIVNATVVQTQVNNLVQGVFQFELKVTDAGGLFSKDTMQIIVNNMLLQCSVTMTPIGTLSIARDDLAAAATGTKILFAGGWIYANDDVTSRVDIYDIVSQTWSIAELSEARYDISAITVGNKVFFAGGTNDWFFTSTVDIYDASSNTWTVANLSKARGRLAVAAIGNKVFFAGGDCFDTLSGGLMINSVSDVVDIYDIEANSWSISHLSERRGNLEFGGTSLDNKIYVAGGFFHQWGSSPYFLNKVDVYDNESGSWSTTTLANERADIGTAAADNKIFWAGGSTFSNHSNQVEILDINSQSRSFHQLSQGRGRIQTAIKDNKIVFFTGDYGDKIDIYNIVTETWCWAQIPSPVNYSGVVMSGNKIYIGGGRTVSSSTTNTNQVWKLEF